ncbi:MAG: class I mannose-6-phosphate isomerase [Bacteroidales bacterium]|nr:class I mannose-6-phosphate isomerase [Bacteroidales bacterium]
MEILEFKPILKTLVWGGEKIVPFKGIKTKQEHVGESWEVSDVPGDESIVEGGPYDGRSLTELVKEFKGRLVGEKVYAASADVFPLLFKFIDAEGDLSIQVHPDDALAARLHGPGFNGKTEMWYVVDAAPGAHLFSGLSKEITPEQYEKMVEDGSITDALARYDVHPGDVFFLPAGRIHAICSGCFIAEIQQTSDLTYRIYDYKRLGLDGKPRQLHTEQAKLAIDYRVLPDYRTRWQPRLNERVELVRCKYFTTSIFDLTQAVEEDLSGVDSFVVVMCIEGSGTLSSDGSSLRLRRGTTVLVPAENKKLRLAPEGKAKFICSWIG